MYINYDVRFFFKDWGGPFINNSFCTANENTNIFYTYIIIKPWKNKFYPCVFALVISITAEVFGYGLTNIL